MQNRTAVVLFNLGGRIPRCRRAVSVQPVCRSGHFQAALGFLTQKTVCWLLGAGAPRGAPQLRGHWRQSPLLENTQKQARALETALRSTVIDVFVCMRYWHRSPMPW